MDGNERVLGYMKKHGLLARFIGGISHKKIIFAGKLLGLFVYIVDRRHRRIVFRNLSFAYPDFSRGKIRLLGRDIFKNFGITALEIFQMAFMEKAALVKWVEIKGEKYLVDALNSSRGIILYSAHIGNWELGVSFVSYYFGLSVLLIARRIQLNFLNNLIHRVRTRSGNIMIDKKGALRKMARSLRKGGAVALMIDQSTKISQGVDVLFYDKIATATPVVSILARRFKCIVLPVFCVRKSDGGFILVVKPPLAMNKEDGVEAHPHLYAQETTRVVEGVVREYPEQWFWFHKRWKRHYPHLYKEDIEKRKLRKNKERLKKSV